MKAEKMVEWHKKKKEDKHRTDIPDKVEWQKEDEHGMEKPDMNRTYWWTNETENFYCILKLTRGHKINMDICDTLTSHRN